MVVLCTLDWAFCLLYLSCKRKIKGIGIVLCAVWVIASCPISTGQEIAMAVFTAIVQGILVAGLSTYVNQAIKQMHKEE